MHLDPPIRAAEQVGFSFDSMPVSAMTTTASNTPNCFILGAAKSGTTTLHYHLNEHPEIFMSEVKEPSFFCERFHEVAEPIEYFSLYDSVSSETVIGEASHIYMSNPSTAGVLKALFPEAKFLVILRNPADRAYSLYHHMRRYGYEYLRTFEAALEAEETRWKSERFQQSCPQHFYNYLYFRSGLYGEQLQRYFSLFSKRQFHIIKFEKFVAEPQRHFQEIFQFLGVNPHFQVDLQVHNAGKVTARFPALQYFAKSVITSPRVLRRLLLSVLKRVNRTKIPSLHAETRDILLDRYAEDLRLLYQLTGISFLDELPDRDQQPKNQLRLAA